VGSGSSDLIYRALPLWLTPKSRVVVLTPTYGEYPHVLRNVIGCDLVQVGALDQVNWAAVDMAVLVNPNSPTGTWADLEPVVAANPRVLFWVDEAYVDYAGKASMEKCDYPNLYVCKTMSKAYALSGARVAYLVGPNDHRMDRVKAHTPPWVVSYVAQVAAVAALDDHHYYEGMWELTRQLRAQLAVTLSWCDAKTRGRCKRRLQRQAYTSGWCQAVSAWL
jgi:histidinol-phosphate/aromatic aminotransferase/cobyric acid decarboxylase-like protein